MKRAVFFVLILLGFVFSTYAQWGFLGDLLDEALGNSGSSSNSSSSLQSGNYYYSSGGTTIRLELNLERQEFRVYVDNESVGGGTAMVNGNTLIVRFTYGQYTGTDMFTITSSSSFYSNLDGGRYNRR